MRAQSLTGRLLVAAPALNDPNFDRTVVLILDHGADGALGVVVNRPTPVPVTEVLPTWQPLVSDPDVLFQGGPVALDSALGLVQVSDGSEDPLGVRRLYGQLGLVDLDAPTEVVQDGLAQMRIFAGYAGWEPQQLEGEIAEGAWYVLDAEPADAFTDAPAGLWQRVLRRQGGSLALVANFPADPSLN